MTRCTGMLMTVAVLLFAGTLPADDKQNDSTPTKAALPTLQEQFAAKLSGATLVGSFTVDGQDNSDLKTERYELYSVKQLKGDIWQFDARIKYGDTDVRVPIPITVKWAGDTPILTLTETTIPPLGTFTTRVMFYGDRYAGTWQHDEHGGHMFGRIERSDKPAEGRENESP